VYEKLTFVLSVFLLFFAFLSGSPGLTGRTVSSAQDVSAPCEDYDNALDLFLRQEYSTRHDVDYDNDLDARDLKMLYSPSCPLRHTCARVGVASTFNNHVLRCVMSPEGKRTLVLDDVLS